MTLEKFREESRQIAGNYNTLLETPPKEIKADLAMPCFSLARELRKAPQEIAVSLAKEFSKNKFTLIKEIKAEGSYVNFYANWDKLSEEIITSASEKEYGKGNAMGKVIVEFAHPNTHKLFHIGHLRNIITGESVARMLEYSGVKVIRANYQGDVGLHIAKCLWAIGKEDVKKIKNLDDKIRFLGKAYAKGSKSYEEDENAKKEIIEINAKIYKKDPGIMKLWQETRQWSLDYFARIYARVYTRYDRLFFESEVAGKGLKISQHALKKGILKESDGAVIFDGESHGLDKRVFINSLGFPTYEAKELALAELEFTEFGKIDKCIHVVGPEQASFFKVTFKVEELLDQKYKDKQFHLAYGWVKLRDGKMSSRLGNVIEGEWLLQELKKAILGNYVAKEDHDEKLKEEIAEAGAIGAAKYYFLKYGTASEISFDIKEAASLEGDTGPYLQYTHARAASVLRKSEKTPQPGPVSENETELARKLAEFPESARKAAEELKPNIVANYVFELASMFNAYYHEEKIIGSQNEAQKLALVGAVKNVIGISLNLLGIKPLEKM
ncbi:MAG: arginine--tRNA ligase [Candidatus Aenigmarchaeota archaeon]|nr:arginine--tRNA ligase [Candidatus Aenigmarchaeota archaeon]